MGLYYIVYFLNNVLIWITIFIKLYFILALNPSRFSCICQLITKRWSDDDEWWQMIIVSCRAAAAAYPHMTSSVASSYTGNTLSLTYLLRSPGNSRSPPRHASRAVLLHASATRPAFTAYSQSAFDVKVIEAHFAHRHKT